MYIVGVTGGIGSGKSAATRWFSQQGVDVVDADVVAREVVRLGSPVLACIQRAFGDWVLDKAGNLNRTALREYIFTHPQARQQLEAITHSAIRKQIQHHLAQAHSDYAMLSAPLLLEDNAANLATLCKRILVIDVPEELQLKRASQRDATSPAHIQAVMATQLSRKQRLAKAHDVVDNSGTLDDLYDQLEILHQQYRAFSGHYN